MPNVPITAPSTLTPVSGAASYATPTDFFDYMDVRTVADYLSDTYTPLGAIPNTNPVQINVTVVAASSVLSDILQAASGKIEAAVMVGNRYSPGDLILLTSAPSNMAKLIARIVCGIAAPDVIRRRPDLRAPPMPIIEESNKYLEALASGVAIFGLQETMDAGMLSNDVEQLEDVEFRNTETWRARRMFGRRAKWRDTPEN